MRRTTIATVLSILAGFMFAAGRASVGSEAKLHAETMKNLESAMHGEAFAHAKYLLYAEHARKNGHPDVAEVFEKAANQERLEHFREEAELAGLVKSDADNLRDAIKGENYETTTMYLDFAAQAEKVGDKEAAERFNEVRKDELKHRNEFQSTLERLQRRSVTP